MRELLRNQVYKFIIKILSIIKNEDHMYISRFNVYMYMYACLPRIVYVTSCFFLYLICAIFLGNEGEER